MIPQFKKIFQQIKAVTVFDQLQKDIVTPKTRQVLAAVSVGFLMTGIMTSWGYPAAALPQIEKENSTIHFTPSQSSWFATLPLLMSIPGSTIGAAICEWVGPRKLSLLLAPLMCISSMTKSFASWEAVSDAGMAEILLLSLRVIEGALVAVLQPCAYVYTYEICDQRIRKTMTSLLNAWSTMGFLLCYISGSFLSWITVAWLLPLITYVPAVFGLLLFSEAPLWLSRKGKEETARKVLNKYRCSTEEVEEDLKVGLNNSKDKVSRSEALKVLIEKPNALAILTSNVITIAKECIGSIVIVIYMVHIFDAAGVGLDPNHSSIIVGLVRLICSLIASTLIHYFRRKVLLIIGGTLAAGAAFSIGLFFYLKDSGYDVSFLAWLPLTGLATHMFATAACIGPSSWAVAFEVLPESVRSVGFGTALTSYAVVAFITSKYFVSLQSVIGMYGVFWFFASSACLSVFIVIIFIPETYGLSLRDIEDYWKGTKVQKAAAAEECKA